MKIMVRLPIVIVSDIAKYDIGSSGEYTQGAGAVAILVKQNPRLLSFRSKGYIYNHKERV